MRVNFLILFTFTALTFPSIGSATVRATFDLKEFLIPGEGHFIETHISFDGRSLFWPMNDSLVQASVEATLILNKGSEVIDFKKVRINSMPVPPGSESDFIDIQRFVTSKGEYLLEVQLQDLNDPENRIAKFSQPLTIGLSLTAPCISDGFFVEAYAKTTEPNELTRSGYDILPLVSDYFPETVSKMIVYAEVYNAHTAGIEGDKYLLTSYLFGSDGEVTGTRKYLRKDISQVTPILLTFDISELPSGSYNLIIEMRSPENEELASSALGFTRVAALNKDFMALVNEDNYVGKPGLSFNNPDSIRSYVSWLYPLAQNVERNTIDAQVKVNDTETLQSFFQSFWEEREPEDPIGAWLRYVKEVWYVNKKYKSPIMDGYRTDRGRVFLQYGKPNTIVERHNNPNYFPLEIWHYYKIERFNDKRFLFYSRNVVNYDFNLLHSDMLGEVQNHDWPSIIRTKNNDLRPTDSALNRLAPRDTHSKDEIEDLFYNPR